VDSREFAEWIAYNNLHPIGIERMELILAHLTTFFYNANRAPSSPALKVTDFIGEEGRARQEVMTGQQMKAVMKGVMARVRKSEEASAKRKAFSLVKPETVVKAKRNSGPRRKP